MTAAQLSVALFICGVAASPVGVGQVVGHVVENPFTVEYALIIGVFGEVLAQTVATLN